MSILGKLLGTEKAMEGVKEITSTGMSMWDNSSFTPQEKMDAFEKIAKVLGSKETSISRRIIAWAVTGMIGLAFITCLVLIGFKDYERIDAIVNVVKSLWIGEAFTATIAFYFLTHLTKGK